MALPSRLMGTSFSAGSAVQVVGDVTDSLTATGSNQATALLVSTVINIVTTTAASTGVILMPSEVGGEVSVYNLGANALLVYPATGGAINALATNAGFSVGAGKAATFKGRANGTGWVTILSA